MDGLIPHPVPEIDDDQLWQAYEWPPECLRVNFVTTLDGHASGPDAKSGSISPEGDRRIFRLLRAGCDAVVVGAGTARDEDYGPVTVHPSWHRLRGRRPDPKLVVVTRSGRLPSKLHGDPHTYTCDYDELPGLLAELGAQKVLCEGGPVLFGQLLRDGLVDELALTLSPRIGGGLPVLPTGPHAELDLAFAAAEGSALFTLWRTR